MNPLESELQAALLLAAPAALPSLRLFRRNVGQFKGVRFGIRGQADLQGIVRGGRCIEIEIKAASGSLSREQKMWRDWCRVWQVPHVVLQARKDETVEETVERWVEELSLLTR